MEGGVNREKFEYPPTDEAMGVPGIHCTAHVTHGGDHTGSGMDCLDPNAKRYH